IEHADSGGIASAAIINSGGELLVSSGAAIGTLINSSGDEIVSGGGTISGTTTINGGTLELQTGALVSGGVVFAGGGTLQIDGTAAPANLVISNFSIGATIDAAGVQHAMISSAGNTLTVSSGAVSYAVAFNTPLSGYTFRTADDGQN